MACSLTKFIWNLTVYCGKEEKSEDVARVAWEQAHLAHKIVLELVADVYGKGYIINMDNFLH
jgi:hypothetical protein